jgi:hypothetical protein
MKLIKNSLLFTAIISLVVACTQSPTTKKVEEIKELKTEIVAQFNVSRDSMLSKYGSNIDIQRNSKGDFLFAFRGKSKILVYDKNYTYKQSLLNKGKGPEEVSGYFSSFLDRTDSLFVQDPQQKLIHVYGLSKSGLYEYSRTFLFGIFLHPVEMTFIASSLHPNTNPNSFWLSFQSSEMDKNLDDKKYVQFVGEITKDGTIVADNTHYLNVSDYKLTDFIFGGKQNLEVPFGKKYDYRVDASGILWTSDSGKGTITKDKKVVIDLGSLVQRNEVKKSDIDRLTEQERNDFSDSFPKQKPYFYGFKPVSDDFIIINAADAENDKTILFMNTKNEILGKIISDISLYDIISFENNMLMYSTLENDELIVKSMKIAF